MPTWLISSSFSSWEEYYGSVLDEWNNSSERLSDIERRQFKWDHAQAGAWILKSWKISEEIICYIGAHNLSFEDLKKYELDDTIALPIAMASSAASILKAGPEQIEGFVDTVMRALSITHADFIEVLEEVKEGLIEVLKLFDLPARNADQVLADLIGSIENRGEILDP